jgi:hypothetical protein
MTPGKKVLAALAQIASAASALPEGAHVTVEWEDAPLDLLLLVGTQGETRLVEVDGEQVNEAVWTCGGVEVRAWRRTEPTRRWPTLTLVK